MTGSQWCAVTNKIIFHSNAIYNDIAKEYGPQPTSRNIPKWWQEADLYIKDNFGNPVTTYNDAKAATYKACPAMLDTFTTGYVLRTPCDIEFYEKRGRKKAKLPVGFEEFVGEREVMDGFQTPTGYSPRHFHWYANWAPQLPEGYSSLYIPPINHFDLPFITVGGIIDSDKVFNAGLIPFFLKEDFVGVIPAGTPILQIIPFRREDWEMQEIYYPMGEIYKKHQESSETFRTKEGGVYKRLFWSKRKYK